MDRRHRRRSNEESRCFRRDPKAAVEACSSVQDAARTVCSAKQWGVPAEISTDEAPRALPVLGTPESIRETPDKMVLQCRLFAALAALRQPGSGPDVRHALAPA
jgi:hypothetical protein